MSKTTKLIIATHNLGKAREIQKLLGDIPWQLVSLQSFKNVGIADEIENTYSANAIAKACYYASGSGEWVLADDSGLEVAGLGGAPGVLSARYAGERASDADRRTLLLSELRKQSTTDRTARFVCSVAISQPNGALVSLSQGICAGSISLEPRGNSGFGYDSIFVPEGYDQTFGELSEEIKNQISHRAKALLKTRTFLLNQNESA